MGQPAFDHGVRGGAVEDQARHARRFSHLGGCITLLALEVSGVNHHREARTQHDTGQFMQLVVGSCTGIGVIDAITHCVFSRLLAEQLFADDV